MNIPQAQIDMTKQMLHSLWGDSATIIRTQKQGNTKVSVEVYKNKLCHLSQSKPQVQKQSDTVAVTTSVYELYVDADIVIMQGDSIEISHKGQLFKGIAGKGFNRNFSNVIPIEVKEIS